MGALEAGLPALRDAKAEACQMGRTRVRVVWVAEVALSGSLEGTGPWRLSGGWVREL